MGCCKSKHSPITEVGGDELTPMVSSKNKERNIDKLRVPLKTPEGRPEPLRVGRDQDPNALNITPKSDLPEQQPLKNPGGGGSDVISANPNSNLRKDWGKQDLQRMFRTDESFDEEEDNDEDDLLAVEHTGGPFTNNYGTGAFRPQFGLAGGMGMFGDEDDDDDEGDGQVFGGDFLTIGGQSMTVHSAEKHKEEQLKHTLRNKEANRPISMFVEIGDGKKKKRRKNRKNSGRRKSLPPMKTKAKQLKKLKEKARPNQSLMTQIQQDRERVEEMKKVLKLVRKSVGTGTTVKHEKQNIKRVSKVILSFINEKPTSGGLNELPEIKVARVNRRGSI